MFKKLALVSCWFVLAPIALFLAFFLISQTKNPYFQNLALKNQEMYSSNKLIEGQVLGTQIKDMRPFLVANLLQNRELEPYSEYIVEVSDKYGIDFRLIPAIAMKESSGGDMAPKNSYNAWGFENGRTNFGSWEQAIDTVGKTLKERYVAKGLVTPEQIMPIYAPPQMFTGGKWAKDINYFFSKMKEL